MANVDYMKVFSAAAASLNMSEDLNVAAVDINKYSALIKKNDTVEIEFIAELENSAIELTISKNSIPVKDYQRFLSNFEYNLEQKFFKNIQPVSTETGKEYRIKISF